MKCFYSAEDCPFTFGKNEKDTDCGNYGECRKYVLKEARLANIKLKSQTLKVPNNKKGQDFLKQLKIYLEPCYNVRLRGRNPKHSVARYKDIPLKDANEIGVYIRSVKKDYIMSDLREQLWRKEHEVENLRETIRRLDDALEKIRDTISSI